MRETARRVQSSTGKAVTYVLGGIQVRDSKGNIQRVRSVYTGNGIIIQADNLGVNINQIADHEIYHDLSQNDPGLDAAAEERILERFTPEQFDKILDKYIEKMNGIINLSEDATPEEWEAAVKAVKNEVFADAYAGINAFSAHAETLGGAVNEVTEERHGMRGGEYAEATDRTTGPPERYSVDYDAENRPFVTVEEDILDGVPQKKWVKTVQENLRKKFPSGITVGNSDIKINAKSRREMTFSEYSKWLSGKDPSVYADKFRAANNADEILRASTDWVNEGLNHPRKDNIQDFARGKIQLRIGQNDYIADVVVGTTSGGNMLLYDILNMRRTSIKERSRHTVQSNQTENRRSGASASVTGTEYTAIAPNEPRSRSSAPVDPSIDQSETEVKYKFSLDDDEPNGKDSRRTQKKPPQESRPILAKQDLCRDMLGLFSIPAGTALIQAGSSGSIYPT